MADSSASFCREYVGSGVVSYPCNLPYGHDGPHAATEIPVSMRKREQWEIANSNTQAKVRESSEALLAQFQGPARTTAESLTVNPTPVPGTTPRPSPEVGDGLDVGISPESVVSYPDAPAPSAPVRDGAVVVDLPEIQRRVRVFDDFSYQVEDYEGRALQGGPAGTISEVVMGIDPMLTWGEGQADPDEGDEAVSPQPEPAVLSVKEALSALELALATERGVRLEKVERALWGMVGQTIDVPQLAVRIVEALDDSGGRR